MITQRDSALPRLLRPGLGGVALLCALILCGAPLAAQNQSDSKPSVGILPFDDASGAGISDANVGVLARQLRAALIRSGKLTVRMLTLTPGTALPLEPDQASELGRGAKVDLVVAPTIVKAESKPFQKGATSSRTVFGVQVGGAKATGVNAEVQIQVDLIRASDGKRVDTFTVDGKKSSSSVSTDVGGVSSTLGSVDAASPNFQSSPLGQALKEALEKLAGEVETRSAKALASPTSAPSANSNQSSSSGNPGPGGNINVPAGQAGGSGSASSGTGGGNLQQGANASSAGGQNSASANTTSGGGDSLGNLGLQPFSADEINVTGKKTTTSKVWANSNAMRIEGRDEKGKKGISIMRFDRKVIWILVPDQNSYLEMAWGNLGQWASTLEGAQMQRESLGSGQVGAYHCDKSRLQVTYKGKVYISIEWAAQELNGFVVKRQDEKGQWSKEYQNVQLGAQDPSLFEIPAGYKKMSM